MSKTAGLPTEQTATTEQEMALAQRNGTVNAPGFVIICSRGTRPMLRRCLPSVVASSAVPGWIIGDVMIDAERNGDQAVIEGGEGTIHIWYPLRVGNPPGPPLHFEHGTHTQCRIHAASLTSSSFEP